MTTLTAPQPKVTPGHLCLFMEDPLEGATLTLLERHSGSWTGSYLNAYTQPPVTDCGIVWEYYLFDVGNKSSDLRKVARAFVAALLERRVYNRNIDWSKVSLVVHGLDGNEMLRFGTTSEACDEWVISAEGLVVERVREPYLLEALFALQKNLEHIKQVRRTSSAPRVAKDGFMKEAKMFTPCWNYFSKPDGSAYGVFEIYHPERGNSQPSKIYTEKGISPARLLIKGHQFSFDLDSRTLTDSDGNIVRLEDAFELLGHKGE